MPSALEMRAALERADRLVTLAPERGRRTYENRAVIESGTLCSIEEKGHRLVTDAGRGLGGGDEAPTPSMLLRSALSSCIAIGVKLWAARKGAEIDRVEVVVETDTDARGILGLSDAVAPGFTGTRVNISVTSDASADLVAEIIEKSLRFSPLIDVLAQPQSIQTVMQIELPQAASQGA